MSKHTPGPWALSSGASHVIAACGGGICKLDSIHGAYQDQAANARLIAAAPDLLEACKVFEEWLRREDEGPQYPAGTDRDSPGGHEIWRAWYYGNLDLCDRAQVLARAAIAKAEG